MLWGLGFRPLALKSCRYSRGLSKTDYLTLSHTFLIQNLWVRWCLYFKKKTQVILKLENQLKSWF